MVLVASHGSKLRFPHIWKLHETKFERKQFGGNSIANRSPVKIGKQSDPIPRRQETGRASDEKRISWNNLDLSKGRKTVSPNVGFQGFSSYVELELLQPSVPGNPRNKDRFVDGFAVEPLCFFVARYRQSRLMSVWPQRAYCDNWSFQLLAYDGAVFETLRKMEIARTRNTSTGNQIISDMNPSNCKN